MYELVYSSRPEALLGLISSTPVPNRIRCGVAISSEVVCMFIIIRLVASVTDRISGVIADLPYRSLAESVWITGTTGTTPRPCWMVPSSVSSPSWEMYRIVRSG